MIYNHATRSLELESTGRVLKGSSDCLGIDLEGEVFSGWDGMLSETTDIKTLTPAERLEIAQTMIELWIRFAVMGP